VATIISLAELKEHIEAELADDALQRLLNAADQAVAERYGAIAQQVDEYVVDKDQFPDGRDKSLTLTRKASTITTVTEQLFNDTADTLAADDYDLRGDLLERLETGTNPRGRWGHRIIVTYVPFDDTAQRIPLVVDLVKLELAYRGLSSEKAGDYRMDSREYNKERESILGSLEPGLNFA
jgi:hypothetical protein